MQMLRSKYPRPIRKPTRPCFRKRRGKERHSEIIKKRKINQEKGMFRAVAQTFLFLNHAKLGLVVNYSEIRYTNCERVKAKQFLIVV